MPGNYHQQQQQQLLLLYKQARASAEKFSAGEGSGKKTKNSKK